MSFTDSDDDFDPDDLPPTLIAVARFARSLPSIPWFAGLGMPLDAVAWDSAQAYLDALGFPDARMAEVTDWEEAAEAARNPEWNSAGWEAEEQLRAALSVRAVEIAGDEEAVLMALTHVTGTASDAVHRAAGTAASRFGVHDEALVRLAAGAAVQCAYQAALVLAAADDEDHAFAHKFRLFEAGRWPLGITGATLNIF
ncbi:MAG: hypothetical protein VYB54_13150 [Pseudomonadota bacterium]|nr:hypothetical protein [Pseudomonadota bacterium]